MSSKDKRKDGDADDGIEDAVVVSDTATETGDAGTPRDPGEAPLIAPGDAPADVNPGDGSYFHDRGNVAVDKRADALAAGGALPGDEATGADASPAAAGDEPDAVPQAETGSGRPDADAPGMSEAPPDLETPPEPALAAGSGAAAPPPPPAAPAPEKSGGGFWGPVLGGIVAAGVGFGVATYLDREPPQEGPDPVQQALDAQQQQLGALDGRLTGLDAQLSDIAAAVTAPEDTSALEGRLQQISSDLAGTLDSLSSRFESLTAGIGGLEETLAGVQDRLGAVDERLTAVEKRPLVESSETARAAFSAYERELEQLKADLAAQEERNTAMAQELSTAAETAQTQMQSVEAQASDLQAEAERVAAQAAIREAVARIEVALDRGTPFVRALSAMPDSVGVPDALSANAETGVATVPALRLQFPDAARAALDASIRETVADDPAGRVLAFLRSQSGARSLAPKEGDDPDAVLSRAEAAVADGDLSQAVTELQALPPAGQAAVADWVARAETRVAVVSAVQELADQLTGE